MLASEGSKYPQTEACFDAYLAVNTVSIVARKLKKLGKLNLSEIQVFGNTFPDQPIGRYIGKVF
jgi:hypothetical protein